MTNGAFEILEMEGIRPRKFFQPTPQDFAHTQKVSYGEVYQPDLLPKIAKDNKKAKLTQHRKNLKENATLFNSLLIYKEACEALAKVKITHDGKKYNAIDLFKEHCIYKSIQKLKKDMNFDEKHALVIRWVEFYLLSVIGEFDSILELKNPTLEIVPEPLDTKK
jgi:hypothetical protein